MNTSENYDRERRRMKVKARKNWTTYLVQPSTIRFLVAIGRVITFGVWLIYSVIKVLKE